MRCWVEFLACHDRCEFSIPARCPTLAPEPISAAPLGAGKPTDKSHCAAWATRSTPLTDPTDPETRDLAGEQPDVVSEAARRLSAWHDRMMATMPFGHSTDPLATVLAEGGPSLANAHRAPLAAYFDRLRQTGRAHWIDAILRRHPGLTNPPGTVEQEQARVLRRGGGGTPLAPGESPGAKWVDHRGIAAGLDSRNCGWAANSGSAHGFGQNS